MSREEILARLSSLESAPVAIEALWDGDTSGWFIRLSAVTEDGESHLLGFVSEGTDFRVFTDEVPPWPEATVARQLGGELAEKYGLDFYFPSPDHPEDDCPAWRDRDKGYPCRRCGLLLLQRPDHPWYGVCSYCHGAEKREQHEATWTLEQRAGRRCHICGEPATGELNGRPACAACVGEYEVYACRSCGGVTVILKSMGHTSLCWQCEARRLVESLTTDQRNAIRQAMAQGLFSGLRMVRAVTSCSLHDAQEVLHGLGDTEAEEGAG